MLWLNLLRWYESFQLISDSDVVRVVLWQAAQDMGFIGLAALVFDLTLPFQKSLPVVVQAFSSMFSLLAQWPPICLHPLWHMLKNNVEFRGDWEGGGGIEGVQGNPQLENVLPPVWIQLDSKDCLTDLLDLEKDLKVWTLDGVVPHQGHQHVQVGQHFPKLGPLIIPLLSLVRVCLNPKQVKEYCLDLRPGTTFDVIYQVAGGQKQVESTWRGLFQNFGIKSSDWLLSRWVSDFQDVS